MSSLQINDPVFVPLLWEENSKLNYDQDSVWRPTEVSLVELLEDLGPVCSYSIDGLR